MKRLLVILLIIQILLLAGCTLPLIGEIPRPSDTNAGQEMLTAPDSTTTAGLTASQTSGQAFGITGSPENSQAYSQTGITGAGISTGALDGTSSAISLETTGGALLQTSPVEQASGAAIASVSTGTAVAGEAWQLSQAASDRTGSGIEGAYAVTVYYQDGDGCLIPMTRWIQKQQGIAKAAVGLCIDSAIAREEVAYYGVYPVLPVDTTILGMSINDGIAVIDFNGHLLHYDSALAERDIVASIVYTLTDFKNISRVRILVNGCPQGVLEYGTDISQALGREDVAINTRTSASVSGQGKADVFLLKKANEGFTYMAPVSIPLKEAEKVTDSNAREAELLLGLLLGSKGENGTFSEMPENAELLGCSTENGILSVDFNGAFLQYGGTEKEEYILRQIAYTVRQIEGINAVKILVEGRPAQLPEGTDISAGLTVPVTINDVMDR